ncbi:sugar transferase [uncultured Tateyamaria sp.]|uniref:sugar transferase n=1 Tax=uncultured Tateyamaria sp. TaxID=455651 RepID=UPI00262030C3|nr:sugar transferase [uncultured Tateyamaria sp.]
MMKSIEVEPGHPEHRVPSAGGATTAAWAGFRNRDTPLGGTIKRGMDVTVAFTMLVVLSPLLLGLMLLVYASSSGPVLYRHRRVGYGNRPFNCLKFRTMVINGDDVLERHFQRYPDVRCEWEETRKLQDDPRVTATGHVLRKLSLDELPQLFNVLRGDMSLVGPRPVPADELRLYGKSRRFYLRSRPGITGLWQVSGRNSTTYRRRVAYDRLYVERFSNASDMAILAKTLPAAMRSSETS